MRVICPHCQAAYELDQVDENTILICHRCGTEFGFGQAPGGDENITGSAPLSPEQGRTLPLFSSSPTAADISATARSQPESDATAGEIRERQIRPDEGTHGEQPPSHTTADDAAFDSLQAATPDIPPAEGQADTAETYRQHPSPADEEAPPRRARASIMPWLLTVVLLIAASGFWFKRDAWLDDPWLRSVLINVGMPVEVRDKDWRIPPESVQAQWIKRNDGSQVLVVEGRVKNLLQCELAPPAILFSLYAKDDPEHLLLKRELPMTQPPLMSAIRSTPFPQPPRDRIPITALADRGFVLVLEDLPENAGDFFLAPLARGIIRP